MYILKNNEGFVLWYQDCFVHLSGIEYRVKRMDVNNRISRIESELSIIKDILNKDGFLTRVRKRIYKTKAEKHNIMEKKFIEMMNQGLTIEYGKDNDVGRIINYYVNDGTLLFSFELNNRRFYITDKFWLVFKDEFKLNEFKIKKILTDFIQKHLGLTCINVTRSYVTTYITGSYITGTITRLSNVDMDLIRVTYGR